MDQIHRFSKEDIGRIVQQALAEMEQEIFSHIRDDPDNRPTMLSMLDSLEIFRDRVNVQLNRIMNDE